MLFRIPFLISKKQSCVLDSWVGDASVSGFSFVPIFLFGLMFYYSCLKLPLRVGRERGSCLEMSFAVIPGHVLNFPLFIA